ncbi:MAG: division/cell wall cluster transcriptional repressor MraZ [bacterium]
MDALHCGHIFSRAKRRLGIMALFFSEQTNRVDKKGRVSVPAQFRSALGEALALGVAAFPAFSLDKKAIDVWPVARLEQLQDSLDRNYDRFSEDQKSLALLIFAEAKQLSVDETGRFMLPAPLLDTAAINGEALFVGQGGTFQVWSPERYTPHKAAIEARAASGAMSLAVFPTVDGGSS